MNIKFIKLKYLSTKKHQKNYGLKCYKICDIIYTYQRKLKMNLKKRITDLSAQLKNIEDNDGFTCDENGRGIINVGAENFDDIFSPYCFKGGDTLSLEMVEYLWEKQAAIPLDYDLTIRFNIKNASESRRKEIQTAVKENYENDIHGTEQKLHRLTVLSVWFVVLGILFMVGYLVAVNYMPLAVTFVLDLLSWVFVWEGVRALFLDTRSLRLDKLKALRLGAAKIEVKEFEPY